LEINNIELRIRDVSRYDDKTPVTTDETLFEGASIKDKINQQILTAVKETAMDCSLYTAGKNPENLVCYGFGIVKTNEFSSYPTLEKDNEEKQAGPLEIRKEEIKLRPVMIDGVKYRYDASTHNLFDEESFIQARESRGELLYIGKLIKKADNYTIDTNIGRYE
jgi:hypothetical protein